MKKFLIALNLVIWSIVGFQVAHAAETKKLVSHKKMQKQVKKKKFVRQLKYIKNLKVLQCLNQRKNNVFRTRYYRH